MQQTQTRPPQVSFQRIQFNLSKRLAVLSALKWILLVLTLLQMLWVLPTQVEVFVPNSPLAESSSIQGDSSEVEQRMRNLKLVEADAKGKQWELNADVATRIKGQSEWQVEQVRIRFFGANGVIFFVTGDRAGLIQKASEGTKEATSSASQIWIRGNVRTVSSNGYKFRSESLNYNQLQRVLWSEVPVQMEAPPEKDGSILRLTASTMETNLNSNEMRLSGAVRGNRVKSAAEVSDKAMKIASQRAVFSGTSRSARFSENVVMDYMKMQVRGPEAQFIFAQNQDELESIFVSGGVRLSDAKRTSSSGTLSIAVAEERITLQGSPRVVQGQDELVGDEIVFLRGGKQVQVLNAKAQFNSDQPNPSSEKRR